MKYNIIFPIILDFPTPQEQETYWIDDGIVECDEQGIVWYIDPSGNRYQTINFSNSIEEYVEKGFIEKINEKRKNK